MRTVIFDLDGTLADTSRDLIAAANACFRDMGHGDLLDDTADAAIAFRGGRAMLVAGLERVKDTADEAIVSRYYHFLLDSYGENIDRYSSFYPGAVAAVDALIHHGYAVGICTNKPEALALTLMDRLGARARFASIIGADTLPTRKPDPAPYLEAVRRAGGDPARSLLVGDTITDRDTARAAGVPCILVGFGPEGQAVEALEPEAILAHFDDLPETVARLIG